MKASRLKRKSTRRVDGRSSEVEKSAGTFCQRRCQSGETGRTVNYSNRFPFPSWASVFFTLSLSLLFIILLLLSDSLFSSFTPYNGLLQWPALHLQCPGSSPPSPMRRPTRPVLLRLRRSTLRLRRSWYVTCDMLRVFTSNLHFESSHCVHMVYLSSRPRRMRVFCHLGVIFVQVSRLTCAQ